MRDFSIRQASARKRRSVADLKTNEDLIHGAEAVIDHGGGVEATPPVSLDLLANRLAALEMESRLGRAADAKDGHVVVRFPTGDPVLPPVLAEVIAWPGR
jgi:hypothetical protein